MTSDWQEFKIYKIQSLKWKERLNHTKWKVQTQQSRHAYDGDDSGWSDSKGPHVQFSNPKSI